MATTHRRPTRLPVPKDAVKACACLATAPREVYRAQASLLKALASEARLMIVDRLGQGECTAGELVALVGYDQSTVSKHLALLRAHGIVVDRREGNNVVYRLAMPCVLTFLVCASQALQARKA